MLSLQPYLAVSLCVLVMRHSSSVDTIKQQQKIQLKSFKLYLIKFEIRFKSTHPRLISLNCPWCLTSWPILAKRPCIGLSFEVVNSLMLNFTKGVNSRTASNCNINQRAGKLKIKICTSKKFTMLISILFYKYRIFRGTP